MAPIKITEVISFSNEDPKHPAENLLEPDSYQKWKCATDNTEKQVYVILKLESLTTVNSIDIGNESSAFVEVLAGREGVDYKVLLPASSFMSPLEARNNTQINRVRLFPIEKLTKTTAEEKWDRIKIICTQPFNKSLQYGLSFVKLHSIEKIDKRNSAISVGTFTLNESDTDDSIKVGTFFKTLKTDTVTKKDGGSRYETDDKSSTLLLTSRKTDVSNAPDVAFYQPKKKENAAKRPLDDETTSTPSKKRTHQTKKLTNRENEQFKETEAKKIHRTKERETKPESSQVKSPKVQKKHRHFCQLLNDVVFVLSGYQNPQRSDLRDKMIQLGARYKSDWDKSCTHLLCAFRNTPKYRAIKGKGIIVNEKWAEDCYRQKKRFSSTSYFLEKSQTAVAEEEEIWADEIIPKNPSDPLPRNETDNIPEKSIDLSDYDADTDDEDTDDELRRIISNQNQSKHIDDSKTHQDSVYDDDTDIDEENQIQDTSNIELPPLPDYFGNKIFCIYGSFDDEEEKLIKRYIIGFNGKIEEYMTEEVNYVITENTWDQHFEDALFDNPALQFVRPQWIWECSQKQKFVSPEPFSTIPPNSDAPAGYGSNSHDFIPHSWRYDLVSESSKNDFTAVSCWLQWMNLGHSELTKGNRFQICAIVMLVKMILYLHYGICNMKRVLTTSK